METICDGAPDRYVPGSRGGWGCAVVATPRDASKQGGQDRVRTLSAAHDGHRSGALRHTPVSSLYIPANDEPTVGRLYILANNDEPTVSSLYTLANDGPTVNALPLAAVSDPRLVMPRPRNT